MKPPPTTITIAGSTALVPLLEEASKRYTKEHPNVVVNISGGGSRVGLEKVLRGEVTFGASDVVDKDHKELTDHRIAVIGLAAVAHKGSYNAGIDSLTKDEIRDIFTGKIKNWSSLGGDDQPIVVVNREKGSGTRAAFGQLTLGGDLFVAGEELDSSTKVLKTLQERRGAVSYLALSYKDDSVQTLRYDGIAPTTENIIINRYPIWAYEHLYSKGNPSEAALDFVGFVTSGRFQREVLPKLGFIALHDMRAVRDGE
ncbi:MAG TPA: phosphate ABC transporter substrate-binding protein [Polyangiaceae bacterium]|nr:phosphate ABC transporter substrate-binding protein [Polyangiaceae bacterium]